MIQVQTQTPRATDALGTLDAPYRGLRIQSFAGGSGAFQGASAPGESPDVTIHHGPVAIASHRANHPETTNHTADVFEVDPRVAARAITRTVKISSSRKGA